MPAKNHLCRLFISLYAFALGAVAAEPAVPLFEGLGAHRRTISTRSAPAQRYFDQGLNLLFGFNHSAAIRSFQESARLDPGCAMAHWGIALASGPHINSPAVPPPMAEQAWAALQLARKHVSGATPVERALIEALGKRYALPQPEDRGPLDRAYADAMRDVWRSYPRDADVGVLFAEAVMDLRPWDQWTSEGQAQPGTEEIVATLDAVLRLDAMHPFANHLYIHAVEASPHPERAMAAADRLRDAQPILAHNVHMPSHIDIRVGDWHKAIASNLKAVEAAGRFHALAGPPAGMILFYNAHNHAMLVWAAVMTGQSGLALHHARTMVAEVPAAALKEFALFAEGLAATPYEVLVRFGRWDEILSAPDHPGWMTMTRTMRHAARAIAFAARNDLNSARTEQAAFLDASQRVPAGQTMGNNTAQAILAIVAPMLEGELLIREEKITEGVTKLREAVKAEDALKYDEPPVWILPVRHSLGATLVQTGRFGAAEEVYLEDLKRLPENGWSLFGLARSLKLQNKTTEAAAVEARFKKTWANADLELKSSCLCEPGM